MDHTKYDLFVGCYGKQDEETIHWLEYDAIDETIRNVTAFAGVENASFLAINQQGTRLYAISEVNDGEIVSLSIDRDQKKLHELNRTLTKGGPCFVQVGCRCAVHAGNLVDTVPNVSPGNSETAENTGNSCNTDDYLFTANYGGGSLIVHGLDHTGEIAAETDFIEYPKDNSDQGPSRLHTIVNISGSFYAATDLGRNKLYVYRFDAHTGRLSQKKAIDMPAGSGPRHIACHPVLNRMYVINEYNSTVTVFSFSSDFETVELEQTIKTIPDDFTGDNYGAHVAITPSGNHVFTSNRGHHSITAFQVKADGTLVNTGSVDVSGKWPRHFTIVPDSRTLLVANEHTNDIISMGIHDDGRLHEGRCSYPINKPVCLVVSAQT